MIDAIGQLFWYLIFISPLIVIPVTWKKTKGSKWYKLLVSLFIAVLLSVTFYAISMTIVFRNGLGTT